jgi:esterase/lipase
MAKKKVLCLSGWAQKSDSLNGLFDRSEECFEVVNFDYSRFENVDDFFGAISSLNINPDLVVGWSLGGQLACRLIEKKIVTPKYLVLLAAPFQFVKDSRIGAAMPKKSYDDFYKNFVSKPDKTLKRFSLLMNINDKNAKDLANNLDINDDNHDKLAFWLKELEKFSCYDIDFEGFPKAMIVHGSEDMVVHFSQSKMFESKISGCELEVLRGCGHVTHIVHKDYLGNRLLEFIED